MCVANQATKQVEGTPAISCDPPKQIRWNRSPDGEVEDWRMRKEAKGKPGRIRTSLVSKPRGPVQGPTSNPLGGRCAPDTRSPGPIPHGAQTNDHFSHSKASERAGTGLARPGPFPRPGHRPFFESCFRADNRIRFRVCKFFAQVRNCRAPWKLEGSRRSTPAPSQSWPEPPETIAAVFDPRPSAWRAPTQGFVRSLPTTSDRLDGLSAEEKK